MGLKVKLIESLAGLMGGGGCFGWERGMWPTLK